VRISIVVAVSRNGVIGRDNRIPWRLPRDRRHFRRLTLGKPVVMGRLTYESIGRPLDGRTNIVVTRDHGFAAPGCRVVGSFEEALEAARPAEEAMVIGGGEIYARALPVADRVYLTRVETEVEGDAFFPELSSAQWREVESQTFDADERNPHPLRFVTLERMDPRPPGGV
jgi:dihydrofolate reductase